MDNVEEIKAKLDIVDVIREYISLKPAGINFRALCPFHREKSPSFMVSPEKQIFHCFGCGQGGDVFTFVQEIEGINFVEALRMLAPKAGVTLKRQDPKLSSQRNRLLDIMEIAQEYYHQQLLESQEATEVRKYLADRGLTKETITEWKIGYSPDSWDDLTNLLNKKGYSDNEIFLAGLSIKSDKSPGRFYNRFRSRIMFPINDYSGAPVAFSARISPAKEADEQMGKYINSPATMVYDKSRILFGLDRAKLVIKNEDLAVITEGQMDVITAHQHGFKNVVASSGTALTGDQILLLKRYTNNISLAFDMDKAGQLAADRGIKEAMAHEMNIKVIVLEDGKDPDECIREAKEKWQVAVDNSKHIMQYYFDKIFAGFDLEKIEDRREAAKKVLPILMKLGNKIEQDFWLKKLSEKIEIDERVLRETLENIKGPKSPAPAKKERQSEPERERRSREEMLSELLLALILKFPDLIDYIINHIQIDQIIGQDNKNVYRSLIMYYNSIIDSQGSPDNETRISQVNYLQFKNWLENQISTQAPQVAEGQIKGANNNNQLKLLDRLVLLGDKDFYSLEVGEVKNETIKIIAWLKKYYLIHRMKEIEKIIAESEKEGDKDRVEELMQELKVLSDEMREIGD